MHLTYKAHNDPHCHNLPTTDEIAVILPGDGTPEGESRDIILHQKHGGLRRISDAHPTYAPLHYALLSPRGELGWHWNILIRREDDDDNAENPNHSAVNAPNPNAVNASNSNAANAKDPAQSKDTVSQINYYAYCLFPRHGEYNSMLLGGKLLQQYIVDSWAS